MAEYKSKATTTRIVATSRVALKIRDNYYTLEATEERTINDPKADVDKEWDLLFSSVNDLVDYQAEDTLKHVLKK